MRVNRLVGLAFSGAIGLTFLLLACALPQYNNWWPMFVLIFYCVSPVPMVIARKLADSETSSVLVESMIFITTGIVLSAYGLPIILAHNPLATPVIQWGACGLIIAGNTVVFGTIAAVFCLFRGEDSYSSLGF